MTGAATESALRVALEQLEQLARDGQARERRELAVRLLELHPEVIQLYTHLVLATFDAEGSEAARNALHSSTRTALRQFGRLPPELLEVHRELNGREASLAAPPPMRGEIVEVAPASVAGLFRVTFSDGFTTQISATILERVYKLRVSPREVVQ